MIKDRLQRSIDGLKTLTLSVDSLLGFCSKTMDAVKKSNVEGINAALLEDNNRVSGCSVYFFCLVAKECVLSVLPSRKFVALLLALFKYLVVISVSFLSSCVFPFPPLSPHFHSLFFTISILRLFSCHTHNTHTHTQHIHNTYTTHTQHTYNTHTTHTHTQHTHNTHTHTHTTHTTATRTSRHTAEPGGCRQRSSICRAAGTKGGRAQVH